MPAEKKDRRSGADNASAGWLRIFCLPRCPPDRWAPKGQLSAPFRGQNLAGRLRVYSLARTFEFAIRSACCSSSPIQELASRSRATASGRAAAALPSTSGGYKAAGPGEIEPGLRSPEE